MKYAKKLKWNEKARWKKKAEKKVERKAKKGWDEGAELELKGVHLHSS